MTQRTNCMRRSHRLIGKISIKGFIISSSSSHTAIRRIHIAPCGMNCGVCIAYLRDKNRCPGCKGDSDTKSPHCVQCSIKNCGKLKASGGKYCFSCGEFPCKRLRHLDQRYRTKYGMSMIDNLRSIEKDGINTFVTNERRRWKCRHCGNIVSVHRAECLVCSTKKNCLGLL
jgi:hypothetical protein